MPAERQSLYITASNELRRYMTLETGTSLLNYKHPGKTPAKNTIVLPVHQIFLNA